MVLGAQAPGRVGRRRIFQEEGRSDTGAVLFFMAGTMPVMPERSSSGSARRGRRRTEGSAGPRRSDSRHTGGGTARTGGGRDFGGPTPPARKPWSPEGGLPKWLSDELARVTPKQNIKTATELLQSAAQAFAAGRHGKALHDAEEAKELSPRDATIRELLGLSAYRLGRWDQALRELKTFRRFTGDTTHMPVEMDVLRALDRPRDVEATWAMFEKIGGDKPTRDEAKVVFGSYLLDAGEDRRAWEVTGPKRLGAEPGESELRVWYVAAKAAQRLGDRAIARKLYETIERADAAFPGLDELDRLTGSGA